MAVGLPAPDGLTMWEWANRFRESYPKQVPVLQGDDWVSWAEQVVSAAGFRQYNLPRPAGFTGFEDWAVAVLQAAPRL